MAKQRCTNCAEGMRPQCCGCAYNPAEKLKVKARSSVPPPKEFVISHGKYVYKLYRVKSEWEINHHTREQMAKVK